MPRARYVMIGGFLGAGKTTAILELARHLIAQGRRVGVIMNDQSSGLVDTAVAAAQGFEVAEVAGGCFCCRFNSLIEAADRLTAATAPDVFIAEPVGSCTDLKATVAYPLRRMYGNDYEIAPLSVIVDPLRAVRVLGLEPGRSFSSKVLYIYAKQLEEADLIVLNKRDLMPDDRRWDALRAAMAHRFPHAEIFDVSARAGTGLGAWFTRLLDDARAERIGPAELDYQRYGEGEALLGWLNALVQVAGLDVDGNRLLLTFAAEVQRQLAGAGVEVAHLKLTLSPDDGADIAVVNLVGSDRRPELSHALAGPIEAGELIVNVRAEADPDMLRRCVVDVLDGIARAAGAPALQLTHVESFRPGQPVPTYRLAEV
jgi:G3E family GTPase